jgi:glycerol-3-phosphate dehydrogenase (NAD(P)+)
MSEVIIVGAGAWGRALAVHAYRAGRSVTLWARRPESVVVPEGIAVTGVLIGAPLVLLVVPVQHMRGVAAALPPGGPVVVCAKGVEADSHLFPLEILTQCLPGRPSVVLTGPNFAHEVQAGLPAASVVAGPDPEIRAEVLAALGTASFRLYGNDDAVGAQVGGAAKNVVAIAAGAAIGAGFGENARAALVTRGIAELARLSEGLGGNPATVSGLSGLGDLLLTCTGNSSRNFSLGVELGRGRALDDILASRTSVAEGVATAPAIVARAASAGVQMPVCAAVSAVLSGQMTVLAAMEQLQSRPFRDE